MGKSEGSRTRSISSLDQPFRNAPIDAGEVTLWVIRYRCNAMGMAGSTESGHRRGRKGHGRARPDRQGDWQACRTAASAAQPVLTRSVGSLFWYRNSDRLLTLVPISVTYPEARSSQGT